MDRYSRKQYINPTHLSLCGGEKRLSDCRSYRTSIDLKILIDTEQKTIALVNRSRFSSNSSPGCIILLPWSTHLQYIFTIACLLCSIRPIFDSEVKVRPARLAKFVIIWLCRAIAKKTWNRLTWITASFTGSSSYKTWIFFTP